MASAAMPALQVAGTRESDQYAVGDELGIVTAVITDTAGRQFDVCISDTDDGKTLLSKRARAAAALSRAKEPASLGFALEQVVTFSDATVQPCATGDVSVLIRKHNDGYTTALDQLTDSQCASVGTAIGAIHRLRANFIRKEGYASYTAEQIRHQLEAWMKQLRTQGQIPTEIVDNWQRVVATDGLWSFTTCLVHGGFDDGDMLFSSTGLNAIYHWSDIQVNDPARDLAWMFDKLNAHQRTIVLSSYARIVGSHLDELIMLRASLWRQMEQVGAFMQALDRADNNAIMLFKSRVEQLAHQLAVRSRKVSDPTRQPLADPKQAPNRPVQHISIHQQPQQRTAYHSDAAPQHAPVIGERLTDEQQTVSTAAHASSSTVLLKHNEQQTEGIQNLTGDQTIGSNSGSVSTVSATEHQHVTRDNGQNVDADAPTEILPRATSADSQSSDLSVPNTSQASTGVGIERTDGHPTGYVSLVETPAQDQDSNDTADTHHEDAADANETDAESAAHTVDNA